MSALLLTLPFGKYFGFDEIWDDGARHTEAYCSSLSWNGTNPGPADDDDGRGDGVSRRLSNI